jgi:branched-chain amino acid transport system substrate-binding protein
MVRMYATIPQLVTPMAQWISKQGLKRIYIAYSDYGPGIDTKDWFSRAFVSQGGEIAGTTPLSLRAIDFSAELQRIRSAKPDRIFLWIPPSPQTRAFINQYRQAGLDAVGIKIFGDGNLTDEQSMQTYGDEALGIVTSYNYSSDHDSPLNRQFIDGFKTLERGYNPGVLAVTAFDAMRALYHAVEAQSGSLNLEKTMSLLRNLKLESPRGPIEMNPELGDLTQDIYIRRVERKNGELVNVEFDRFAAVPPLPR